MTPQFQMILTLSVLGSIGFFMWLNRTKAKAVPPPRFVRRPSLPSGDRETILQTMRDGARAVGKMSFNDRKAVSGLIVAMDYDLLRPSARFLLSEALESALPQRPLVGYRAGEFAR